MINIFSGGTADDVWRQANNFLRNSECFTLQQSRLGEMREILHASLHIDNPRERWVASRSPHINPAFAIAEVFWILSGRNDSDFVNFWNPALPKYAGRTSEYYGAYGFRLRNCFGFDQIEHAYEVLRNDPDTRQMVLQIWNPRADFPNDDGSPRANDIPCNICSLLKVRNGKLEWLQVMRSNDLFRGTPYNFIQFTTLQEILAGWLKVEVGSYCQIADSLHLYTSDVKELSDYSTTDDFTAISNCDDLRLPKDDWDKVFNEMCNFLNVLSSSSLTPHNFIEIIHTKRLPESYLNLLVIAAADCARRHCWNDEMNEAVSVCSNKQLIVLWTNWEKRYML